MKIISALTHKHRHDSARIRHDRRRQRAEAFSHLLRRSLSWLHKAQSEWATPHAAAVISSNWAECGECSEGESVRRGREEGEEEDSEVFVHVRLCF